VHGQVNSAAVLMTDMEPRTRLRSSVCERVLPGLMTGPGGRALLFPVLALRQ